MRFKSIWVKISNSNKHECVHVANLNDINSHINRHISHPEFIYRPTSRLLKIKTKQDYINKLHIRLKKIR
ncbi:hypothetical protein HanRHA438_Chr12g0574371 [Helianthus annuus]|nr:hypothetical protein HanRHA438_Chr12g0574371 [Helianthus annuus]